MRRITKTAILVGALSLIAAPAFAFDGTDNPGAGHVPEGIPPHSGTDNPGIAHVTSHEARAIGRDECAEFKTNFGENKSQFGKCVAAVAKSLRQGISPAKSCAGLNRKPAAGEHRSDFSACVEAAAHALKDES